MRRSIFRTISRRLLASGPCSSLASTLPNCIPQIPTMSTRRPLYEHIDDVERLDYYRPGGYHPIQIGDRFQDRYQIVHKLGYGSYSTIWLARDEQMAKYVAIKVGTADYGSKEVELLSRISPSGVENREFGRNLIPLVLGRFNIDGPNGTDPCFVTAPARCSLADAAQAADYSPFQLHVARSLSAQLAMAVVYIHELGYVHGDLHMGNILLQLPKLDCLSTKQLYDEFDPPDPEPVVRVDKQPLTSPSIPTHVYSPVWLGKPGDEVSLPESRILLADFGTAFCPAEEPRFESYTPLQSRLPEVRFEPTESLSEPFLDSWLFGPDDATADQVDALGPMPDEWWEAWEGRSKHFIGNGKPKEGREVWTFDQRFEDTIQAPRRRKETEGMDKEERDALFEMVRGMLVFRPGDRLSASQVLRTEWMRKWAIPEAEKTWGQKLLCNNRSSRNS
ncbi:kinase domain-containing protein [Phialemonium atrogriseum]|uniref:non-specific serine/threonine protein kinase n=1 Tax=Phialemonium atrogriseum TaxID=1093897 RepID=A0AAJ0FP22_9PEZI|nr:kinase domain-containing protein [Phialemonium atrogriseum]KAK1767745.1 kinase domain-containing protein [Phialemonium atrogriseum]